MPKEKKTSRPINTISRPDSCLSYRWQRPSIPFWDLLMACNFGIHAIEKSKPSNNRNGKRLDEILHALFENGLYFTTRIRPETKHHQSRHPRPGGLPIPMISSTIDTIAVSKYNTNAKHSFCAVFDISRVATKFEW